MNKWITITIILAIILGAGGFILSRMENKMNEVTQQLTMGAESIKPIQDVYDKEFEYQRLTGYTNASRFNNTLIPIYEWRQRITVDNITLDMPKYTTCEWYGGNNRFCHSDVEIYYNNSITLSVNKNLFNAELKEGGNINIELKETSFTKNKMYTARISFNYPVNKEGIWNATLNAFGNEIKIDPEITGCTTLWGNGNGVLWSEGFETNAQWTITPLGYFADTTQVFAGSYAFELNASKANKGITQLIANDTSECNMIMVQWIQKDDDLDVGDTNLSVLDSGGHWDVVLDLNGRAEDVWQTYIWNTTDSQYKHAGFKISINGSTATGENHWVDALNITCKKASVFTLTAPITDWAGTGACINITASNVWLDCQSYGNWIDGTDGATTRGITSKDVQNITVKNCNLTQWEMGIHYDGVTTGEIINTSTSDNNHGGIYLEDIANINITNATSFLNTDRGIGLRFRGNVTISNCTAHTNSRGIELLGISNVTTRNNYINNNSIGFALTSFYCPDWVTAYYTENTTTFNNLINNTINFKASWEDWGCGGYPVNRTNYFNTTKIAGIPITGNTYFGGNYWSDYSGTSADCDYLGDTPYVINATYMNDYLPLVYADSGCGGGDTCTPPAINNNYIVACSDDCQLPYFDLGTGKLTMQGVTSGNHYVWFQADAYANGWELLPSNGGICQMINTSALKTR
jgi:parallel beta-helix repeat protein